MVNACRKLGKAEKQAGSALLWTLLAELPGC